jgi:pyruvate/2-oxoglutarate dehydrogenase complex dihydrolipoamide acyltransferase (E2) component
MDVIATKVLLGDEGEAEISSWLVDDGALVTAGQAVAELETAKVRVQIEAPAAGTLQIISVAGTVIEPGAVIARIA